MSEFTPAITPEIEASLASLRARHGLSPIRPEDEGTPLASLPDNIYGFTFSPPGESTPLFARRTFQSFEVHKLTEGRVHWIGFVTEAEQSAITTSTETVDVKLYPEPHGDSRVLVEISLERIGRARQPSRSEGNYLPLSLTAAG